MAEAKGITSSPGLDIDTLDGQLRRRTVTELDVTSYRGRRAGETRHDWPDTSPCPGAVSPQHPPLRGRHGRLCAGALVRPSHAGRPQRPRCRSTCPWRHNSRDYWTYVLSRGKCIVLTFTLEMSSTLGMPSTAP